MPFSGQLWYITEGGDADTKLVRVNDDGASSTTVVSNGGAGTGDDAFVSSFTSGLGVDTATGFYFAILSNSIDDHALLVRGSINSAAAPTTVVDFPDAIIVESIEVDAVNRKIYVGYQDGSATPNGAITGIRVYSYDAAGTLTDLGFLTTAATDNRANEGGFFVLDPRDFAIDTTIVAGGRMYYTETIGGLATGLFRLDLANPNTTTVALVSDAQFNNTTYADGVFVDVEVDESTDLVYFTTHSRNPSPSANYDANDNALWYISGSASSGTAVKVTLVGMPGGNHFYAGDMTFDASTRQLYIESEEVENSGTDTDDVIYVFQLDGAGTTATLIRTIDPGTTIVGATVEGMAFADLAALTVTGAGTAATEQAASATTLLSGSPTIVDNGGGYLVGATVQITGGTFSSNENSSADDHLGYGAGKQVSGTIAGTSITVSWNAATETLTLSGYDTFAHYQTALAGLVYWATGDNPTNYGANASRTITWTINDGTPGVLAGSVNSGTTTINITSVNDAPVNGTVSSATGNENSDIAVTGLQVSDVDANPASATVTVTLSVTKGILTLRTNVASGLTAGNLSGNGTGTVTVTGTINAINTTLAASNGLLFHGNTNVSGTDTLTVVTSDGGSTGTGGTLSDTDNYTITIIGVNDAPTIAGDGTEAIAASNEDLSLTTLANTISGLFSGQYSDPDGDAFAGVAVIANGSSAGTGQWQYWNGATWVNIGAASTAAAVQLAASTAVRFAPATDFNGPAPTLTVRLVDASGGAITNGSVVNTTTNGGSTAYSTGTVVLSHPVTAVNDGPTGGAHIAGAAVEDQVLSAVSTLVDPDGLGPLHYQWQRDSGGGYVNVGADQSTYVLSDPDVGAVVRVVVTYTDGGGTVETTTSETTSVVSSLNHPHTGEAAIIGVETENQVLTAVSTLADVDGLGALHYDWQRDTGSGYVSTGAADQATYTLGDADVGATVRVIISYTDAQGFSESATSAGTGAIANVNDVPTGGVSISGTTTENQVLTANASALADDDGLGALHYQWQRDQGGGFVNVGIDQSTYMLGDSDVGGVVRVVVSYVDQRGAAETVTSMTTTAISGVNEPHTGAVSVVGAPSEDQVLTAVSTLADADGLGVLHYQWQRDSGGGFANIGMDQPTYALGDSDVGGVIRVIVTYIDGQGFAELAVSDSSAVISNVNDAPVAADDVAAAIQRLSTAGSVRFNDADVDDVGTALVVASVSSSGVPLGQPVTVGGATVAGAYGRLTINPDGSYVYLADQEGLIVGQTATDTFGYTINDPSGASATAQLIVTITGSAEGDAKVNIIISDAMGHSLTGRGGADMLTGGGGADTFVYEAIGDSTSASYDTITDFVHGQDALLLTALMTASTTVTLATDGIDRTVLINQDGAGPAEGLILAKGLGLQVGDIVTGAANFGFTITGSSGSDALVGGGGSDVIRGFNGNDQLFGRGGSDVLEGGSGDDLLAGGEGGDVLNGDEGQDTVSYSDALGGVRASLISSAINTGEALGDVFIGVENLLGSTFNDALFGDNSSNILTGAAGDDRIEAGGDADRLFGGEGNDSLAGQGGNDRLDGGAGDDLLSGGASGRDWFIFNGPWGQDTVTDYEAKLDEIDLSSSGLSLSQLTFTQSGLNALITGPAGTIKILNTAVTDLILRMDAAGPAVLVGTGAGETVSGLGGNEQIFGRGGADTLNGGAGDDELVGGVGGDRLNGGEGQDTASYRDATSAVRADLAAPVTNTGDAGGDLYVSIENLLGSDYNDRLYGDNAANLLTGAKGQDVIQGGGGADALFGGDGNDELLGQGGNDRLDGGAGNDVLTGGLGGKDWFAFAGAWANDVVTDFEDGIDLLDLRGAGISYSSLQIDQQGVDVLVTLAGFGTILIVDEIKANITAADFLLL